MIYSPLHTETQLENKFSKLKKVNYNPFFWWRMYKEKVPPLGKKSSLKDKIQNGDFDYSHYKFQAEWCEHQINKIYEATMPDIAKFNEQSSILRSRRKRLLIDFEKDEKEKLDSLKKEFSKIFSISEDTVLEEMENFSGSLIEFYTYIKSKY